MTLLEFVQGKELILKAKEYATEKHAGVKRKFDGKDYITHPEAVAELVEKFGGNDEMIAAAWLHDVVEDTKTPLSEIEENFGSVVAKLVGELTNPPKFDKGQDKSEYMAKKLPVMSSDGLTIKLCDRLNNVSDFSTASPEFVKKYAPATKYILDALEDSERPLNSQQERIIDEIRKSIQPYENN